MCSGNYSHVFLFYGQFVRIKYQQPLHSHVLYLVLVATASEARNPEGEIQFSRLEALDPQKRELLEARFSTPRVCAEFTYLYPTADIAFYSNLLGGHFSFS